MKLKERKKFRQPEPKRRFKDMEPDCEIETEEDFERLFEKYSATVEACAKKFAFVRTCHGVLYDDLYSEGLLKLVETLARFSTKPFATQQFKAYLLTALQTAFWDVVRKDNVVQKPRGIFPTRVYLDGINGSAGGRPYGALQEDTIFRVL